ncbi:type III secretion system export apparatus subunit SctT (plasmid) [Pantoea sp. BJ2]|uniref:Type III secretion system export apparatus subunit SctT n=1 Tax=Pantoea sp. BJ2 TaxID=3141322 RepID=A0AAU7U3K4_9GAMM
MAEGFQLFSEFHYWIYGVVLSSARLFPAFLLFPFFSNSVVTDFSKYPIVFIVGAVLWPYSGEFIGSIEPILYIGLLVKELITGLIIAMFICLPIWVMHAAGSYIDNQRGATLSSSLSPLSGVDSSELANLFNIFAAALILESGGLVIWLDMVTRSYVFWPPDVLTIPSLEEITGYITIMMLQAIRLSAPVITMFLVAEVLLGLLARYTPQLNAFALAMTVKSMIGFGILTLYFSPYLPAEIIKLLTYLSIDTLK